MNLEQLQTWITGTVYIRYICCKKICITIATMSISFYQISRIILVKTTLIKQKKIYNGWISEYICYEVNIKTGDLHDLFHEWRLLNQPVSACINVNQCDIR